MSCRYSNKVVRGWEQDLVSCLFQYQHRASDGHDRRLLTVTEFLNGNLLGLFHTQIDLLCEILSQSRYFMRAVSPKLIGRTK